MSGGWRSEYSPHSLPDGGRQTERKTLSPTMLLGSSPTGASVFPVGSCGRPAPHGTCSSGREPVWRGGRVRLAVVQSALLSRPCSSGFRLERQWPPEARVRGEASAAERPRPSSRREEAGWGRGSGGRSSPGRRVGQRLEAAGPPGAVQAPHPRRRSGAAVRRRPLSPGMGAGRWAPRGPSGLWARPRSPSGPCAVPGLRRPGSEGFCPTKDPGEGGAGGSALLHFLAFPACGFGPRFAPTEPQFF